MSSLSEKMEHKQVRYRAFLERRLHSYRGGGGKVLIITVTCT